MKRNITLLWLVIFATGCHLSEKKEYRLSDEKMAHLMLDLQLADETLADLNTKQQDTIKLILEKKMQDIYHLTPDEIKQEIELLQTDPKKLKLIIDRAKQIADSIQ